MADLVNHPVHYQKAAVNMEPIDICRYLPFDYGNAIKYVLRAGYKEDYLTDLKKAVFYLEDAEAYTRETDWLYVGAEAWYLLKFLGIKTNNALIYESLEGSNSLKDFFEKLHVNLAEEIKQCDQ